MSEQTILLVLLVVSWYMVGLIWFVQLNHYPAYRQVPEEAWISYQISI